MAKVAWNLDSTHSSVEFSAKHMMVATVRGSFHEYAATIVADPEDLTTAEISFEVTLASVDTGNDDRDNHLRSADFFDVENSPKMTFTATKIAKTGEDTYDLTGDLSLHGHTQPVTFKAEFGGQGKDPWGNERVGFSVDGKLNRKEFGLVWNVPLERGGVLVSENINVHLELQATLA